MQADDTMKIIVLSGEVWVYLPDKSISSPQVLSFMWFISSPEAEGSYMSL